MERKEVIDLLVWYTEFLKEREYIDSDVDTEEPTTIDSFMAEWDKNHTAQSHHQLTEDEINLLWYAWCSAPDSYDTDGKDWFMTKTDFTLAIKNSSAAQLNLSKPTVAEIDAIIQEHSSGAIFGRGIILNCGTNSIARSIHSLISNKQSDAAQSQEHIKPSPENCAVNCGGPDCEGCSRFSPINLSPKSTQENIPISEGEIIEKCKKALRERMHNMIFRENGYPVMAVTESTIASLDKLVDLTRINSQPKEEECLTKNK